MVLFIDACVRENSRTRELAAHLLGKLDDKDVQVVPLYETDITAIDSEKMALIDKAVQSGNYDDKYFDTAKLFAAADIIVIAAPFWDLSFPAKLKDYFENVNVVGITFRYNEKGVPVGLCKGKKMYYVTTAGGKIFNSEYSYGYLKALCNSFYSIDDCTLIFAELLDIVGSDVDAIMTSAKQDIDELFCEKPSISSSTVELFTDGACSGNPGPGGWGAILRCGKNEKELSGGEGETTNNRMELTAVIKGLEALKKKCTVTVYSDSSYVCNGINKGWAKGWKKNGWVKSDKKPALNADLWDTLLTLTEKHDVNFVWVKGHDGHPENERCDELAVAESKKHS